MKNPLNDKRDDDYGEYTPKKNAKGRFGSLALVMVFLNGLIMTLTAFMTLNSFVNGMISENLLNVSRTTQTQIEASIEDLSHALVTVENIIALNEYRYDNSINTFVDTTQTSIQSFDKVFWIHKNRDNDEWVINKIKHNEDMDIAYNDFLNKPDESLVQYIHDLPFDDDASTSVMTDMRGVKSYTSDAAGLHRAIAYIKPIHLQNAEGYLLATAHLHTAIQNVLAEKKSLISLNISVSEAYGNSSLFRFSNEQLSEEKRRVYNPDAQILVINDQQILIQSAYMISDREAFMLRIPYLLLFFGLILTVMGALYIRSTARQSLRLSSMNKELAQKNYDLNTQVKESTRLHKIVKKSERENKAILNSISDIIFEIDQSGTIKFLNSTWHSITGYQAEDSLEKNLFSYLHADDRAKQKRVFDELVKGDRSNYTSHTKIKCANDEYRSVDIAISMLRHDENKNIRAVGLIVDVEERRKTEFALSEAERKYRTIVENIAGGIYQLSAQGKYVSANPAMSKILGYEDARQMIASVHDVNELVYKDVRKRLRFLRELESFRELQNAEFQVYTKSGDIVWIHESARAVYDENEEFAYYEGSVNDITQRKEAEAKLNEAKVESDLASRAKSEFLTNMSHELRTPLNAIIGFSEIIKNESFGPVGSMEYLDYSNDIYDGGKRLLNIINEILDVSRIEAGERVLNEGIVGLHNVVENCIALSASKINEGSLVVTSSIPVDFPSLIGEELGIKQMVMNLLSNAVKFTSAQGRITISAELNQKGGIRLSITDTGLGMDENEVEKALSPFGQVGNTLSKSKAGTGLGLTLVESLIRLHDGSLELLSQKGIGTTATLIFPARRVAKQDGSRAYDPLSIDKTDYDPKSLN